MPPPMSYQPLDRLFWKFLEKVAQDWNKNPYVKVDQIEDYINLNEYRQILLDVEPDAPTEINSSELMIKIPQRNSYSRSGRNSEIYSKRRARKRRAKFEVSVISEKVGVGLTLCRFFTRNLFLEIESGEHTSCVTGE